MRRTARRASRGRLQGNPKAPILKELALHVCRGANPLPAKGCALFPQPSTWNALTQDRELSPSSWNATDQVPQLSAAQRAGPCREPPAQGPPASSGDQHPMADVYQWENKTLIPGLNWTTWKSDPSFKALGSAKAPSRQHHSSALSSAHSSLPFLFCLPLISFSLPLPQVMVAWFCPEAGRATGPG